MEGDRATLGRLWVAIGGDAAALDRVDLSGPRHGLPSVFDVTGLAAGAVAATHLATAELDRAVRGRVQRVAVDRRHAVVAFRSERLVEIDGAAPPSPWDAASGHHRTGDDRLIQVHANFAHHRAGLLAELGVTPDPGDDLVAAAVGAAIAEREGAELEAALDRRGMCGALLRSSEQWSAHPQARAVAELGVLDIERIGDAPVEPTGTEPRPLGGTRVLDLTRVIAGPVCTRVLAAHGAQVLRVDAGRLPVIESLLPDTLLGKRSTFADLGEVEGRRTLEELAITADVFVQSYRPGALAALGFGAEQLAERRPGIVHASLCAYGHAGPWAAKRGFDSLVQTATGIGHAGARAAGLGQPATRPLPAQALDHGAGWILALGVIEALRRRALEGGSWRVRTSLAQVRDLLVSLGAVDALGVPDPTRADVADLLTVTRGRRCRVGHVAVPGSLRATPPGWSVAGGPLGSDPPEWRPL
ncbi:MAG: CoA transferase [Acidimicrobiales bacterium]